MKKRIKKLLSLVLVAFVLVGTTPLSGFVGLEIPDILDLFVTKAVAATYTSGDWEYTVNNNEATLTKYNGTATNITLPTALDGISVKHIGASLFKDNTKIISVVIPEGYKTIKYYAFMNCTYLKSVLIPKTIEKIGTETYYGQAFSGCIRLETVILTEGGSAEVSIENSAFSGCTALNSITIPANYKSIGANAFGGCTNLKTVTIKENTDPYFERSINDKAFANCTSLLEINIPEGFVYIRDSAFTNCANLKTLSIPKSIRQIGNAGSYGSYVFSDCIRLETVILTEGGTAEVSIENSAFSGCTALQSITIPSNYKSIGANAFGGCTNLKTVTIKENTDPYFERSIDYRAFVNCSSLVTVHIPKEISNIDSNAFYGTSESLVICSTTSDCTAKTYAQEKGITFRVCDGTHATPVVKSYTLSYNANGGSGAPSSQVNSATYTIPATIPTRNGYVFIGWSTSNTATTATYLSGDIVTLSANTTLYAVWQVDIVEDSDDSVILTVISIKAPSRTTIDYGDSIILHAELGKDLAEGERIEWSADNGNFSYDVSSDGKTSTITPKSSGETVFTVKVIDKDGNVVSEDTQEMSSNAGFFTKIIAFFKKLFGATKIFTSGIEF